MKNKLYWIIGLLLCVMILMIAAWSSLRLEEEAILHTRGAIVSSGDLDSLANDCIALLQQMEKSPGIPSLFKSDEKWSLVPKSISDLNPTGIYFYEGPSRIVLQFGKGRSNVLFLSCCKKRIMILQGPKVENGAVLLLPRE